MIEIGLKAEGMKPIQAKLAALENIVNGSLYKAVELNDKTRSDKQGVFEDDKTNAEILGYLKEQGRDFVDTSPSESERVAGAFVARIEDFMDKIYSAEGKGIMRAGRNAAANAWKSAMERLMVIVTEHIESGNFTGGGNPELSPAYARFKEAAVGFQKPIGKFSGQLIDNINPNGPSSRNIKVKTK